MADTDSYVARLKKCYATLAESATVKFKSVELADMKAFEQVCNDALPKNKNEIEFKSVIRSMYYTDKHGFLSCIDNNKYLILLAEGRAITVHFKVEFEIYIKWENDKFNVSANSYSKPTVQVKMPELRTRAEPICVVNKYSAFNFDVAELDRVDVSFDGVKKSSWADDDFSD